MSWYFALILGIVAVFYAALPAVGAFVARAQWRRFRKTVVAASRYPTATPASVGKAHVSAGGLCRFFGTLEAIQGDDRIWITNGRFSVAADLRGVRVYLIPESDATGEATASLATAAELRSVPWSRVFSLPEGTPVFVGGALFSEEGRGVFRDAGRNPLLVVIHDCARESIVLRAIGSGRQRNEFINAFTLPSAAIGSLSLILLAFSLLANSPEFRGLALAALTAGLAPVCPFLPPGFPLYFAYRSAWKKARFMRAQRDVVRLPLRYFPPAVDGQRGLRATLLPDMEPYIMIRGTLDEGMNEIVSEGVRMALPADVRRLRVNLMGRAKRDSTEGSWVAFTGYAEEGDGIRLRKPDDPMAEQVLVHGDPAELSLACERAARKYQSISAVFISLNIAMNLPLLFILLSLLIR